MWIYSILQYFSYNNPSAFLIFLAFIIIFLKFTQVLTEKNNVQGEKFSEQNGNLKGVTT